jgi:hypothetical protein
MKIKLDIDCTPEELRAFLGLPDLGPVQRIVVEALGEKTGEAVKALDPEALIKAWAGTGAQGLEALKAFWTKPGG